MSDDGPPRETAIDDGADIVATDNDMASDDAAAAAAASDTATTAEPTATTTDDAGVGDVVQDEEVDDADAGGDDDDYDDAADVGEPRTAAEVAEQYANLDGFEDGALDDDEDAEQYDAEAAAVAAAATASEPVPDDRDLLDDEPALAVDADGGDGIDTISNDAVDIGELGSDIGSELDRNLADDLRDAMEERAHLTRINQDMQRRILEFWERDKRHRRKEEEASATSQTDQIRIQYVKVLDTLNVLWDRLNRKREEAESRIEYLTTQLDREDEKATALNDAFKAFKRDIAREARNSRTGKPIKLKTILAAEAAEEAKDRRVAEVRLKHIHLLNQLSKLETEVKQKEELAEGLHLIDFEQLKIENQTLNEKIEERNDELHKLRKKTTITVQVLTHVKEKLQFVQQENTQLERQLEGLDGKVTELRDQLTKAKQARDACRSENALLKQKQGFIGSDLLVSDFEHRKGELEAVRAQVQALKDKHKRMQTVIARAKAARKEMAHQQRMRMRN